MLIDLAKFFEMLSFPMNIGIGKELKNHDVVGFHVKPN